MYVSLQNLLVFLHNPWSGNDRLEGGVDFSCEQSMPTYEELHVQVPFKYKNIHTWNKVFQALERYICVLFHGSKACYKSNKV